MLIKEIETEKLSTFVYDTRAEMGRAAAAEAACAIRRVIERKGSANVVFAAAPSQNEMLEALLAEELDFSLIHAYHMDEYVGLGLEDAQSFARYLTEHLFSKAPFASVHLIPAKADAEEAIAAYSALLKHDPPDVVCMGIGENGHIAFNDPPVADFYDKALIKRVALDQVCRMQQVHDGCFPDLASVPRYALTLTVPALLSAEAIICTVPAATKAKAVEAMLKGAYGECCPATALRRHGCAKMFLDRDSAARVLE